jgi:glutamate formiminotransferase/formiminotetrahydrofolate cyclodeaminase
MKIIECVPNFSEGRDPAIIKEITDSMESISDITLLDVDMGYDTNRTVVTIVGQPEKVIESAYLGIKKSIELINMNSHKGEHARMGATDVCPFVPIANTTMEECIKYSNILAERVGSILNLPVFLYEKSAIKKERENLANIRSGEYEGMKDKMKNGKWKADFGPISPHLTAGVVAIGARNFLIAYNINLNTQDKNIANDIALDIREQGRNKRNNKGKFIRDKNGLPIKKAGKLKKCKAVGWYIEEYGQAQVSMNLTDFSKTPVHLAFEEVRLQARNRGLRVSGSELIGLIPLSAMISAGKYYLSAQNRSTGIPDKDIIQIAIKSMGLNEINTFNPYEKIIEYKIDSSKNPLASMSIISFLDELSSESPAPGGGSIAALAGSLSASLNSMVANLTFGKKKWDSLFNKMIDLSESSQLLKYELLKLVDEDTKSFNKVMDAYKLPKKTNKELEHRNYTINEAIKYATSIPHKTLKYCHKVMKLSYQAAKYGNPNSVSDAGVACELAYAGARGASLNIYINIKDINDEIFIQKINDSTEIILKDSKNILNKTRKLIKNKIDEQN